VRGRLIFPFIADVVRVDAAAVEAAIDPDFKEPRLVDADDDGVPDGARPEMPIVGIPCQVEAKKFDELTMMPAGDSPRSEVTLVFHFRDLERLGLVDQATGTPGITPGDRLDAIRRRNGVVVQKVPTPPGLYVTEALPRGFGLGRMPSRNLLVTRFESRPVATRRTA
jgi:hypothetical protein